MPKQSDWLAHQAFPFTTCDICKINIQPLEKRAIINGKEVCVQCYDMAEDMGKKIEKAVNAHIEKYNEPVHYHQHELDTITFLQKGFPPAVFMGFAIGHVIKYAQRSEYKGSPREDLVKMVDYAKRALDWYDKTHS
jgi:hypothetical protein